MNYSRMLASVFVAVGGLTAFSWIQAKAEKADAHHEHFAKCAKACADCQQQCDMCFHHCAGLVAEGKKDHAKTMHTCIVQSAASWPQP